MEAAVLGSCLIEPQAIEVASKMLKASDFYRSAHGTIFAAICNLHRAGTPVDVLSVQEKLRSKDLLNECGGHVYLVELMQVPSTCANIEHYAKVVKDKSLRRQWAYAFLDAVERMWASEDDFPVIWEDVKRLVKEVECG